MNTVTIKQEPTAPQPAIQHKASVAVLERIMWQELSLSLARKVVVLLDTIVPAKTQIDVYLRRYSSDNQTLTIALPGQGLLVVDIQRALIATHQATTLEIGNNYLAMMVGDANEPNIVVEIGY